VTADLSARYRAGELVREISQVLGGRGGGRPDFAQGGGSDPSRLDEAFRRLDALIEAG
jgi:alanyl-tRNA synthetase